MKKKYLDFFINALITVIQIFSTQFLIYPLIEDSFKANKFGIFLTTTGLILSIYAPINIALSNFILRNENTYSNIVYLFYIIGLISFTTLSLFFPFTKENPQLILWGIMLGFRTVVSAYIRHQRNFQFMLLGNLLALLICLISINYFQRNFYNPIYLLALYETVLAISYLTKVPRSISLELQNINRSEVIDLGRLYFLNLSTNTSNYFDRFALQRFGSNQQVSIFYIITLFPKLLVTFGATVNGVLLSYLSSEKKLDKSKYLKGLTLPLTVSAIFCVIIYNLAPILANVIYPNFNWINDYNIILIISLLAFFISSSEKLMKGALIRFSKGANLIRLEISSVLTHVLLIIIGLSINFSLVNLSVLILISFAFRLTLTTLEFFKIRK